MLTPNPRRANGITTAGTGLGGIIFSLGTSAMIYGISVQWSLRINAVITLIMTSAAIFIIKDRNNIVQPKQHPFDTELLRRGDVWLLLMWAFFGMFGYITLLYSLPDFALSIKLSKSQATEVITLLHLGTAVGRPFIGVLSDRYGRIKVAAMLTFSCGAACFLLWLPAKTYSATVLFAIISGAILGVFWSVSPQPIDGCCCADLNIDDRSIVCGCCGASKSALIAFTVVANDCTAYFLYVVRSRDFV